MITRGIHLIEVAFFLSKFGKSGPPVSLNTSSWKEAYHIFYEQLNAGRDILSFEHSLKNSRDEFDGHFTDTEREGWKDKSGTPKKLSEKNLEVYNRFNDLSEEGVWAQVSTYAKLDSVGYSNVFEDLMGMQESEKETSVSKTEGGIKVYLSRKAEREPSLRKDAFDHHKYDCMVCGFNFGKFYGDWGSEWAEVHHLIPFSTNKGKERNTDPLTDLAVVCANCHRMIHRKKEVALTLEELRAKIETAKKANTANTE